MFAAELFVAESLSSSLLDLPTLLVVAVCACALIGLSLLVAWLQQRSIQSLAWWGAAYLIGAASMTLWSLPSPRFPPELPGAMIFIACGMIWTGVRLFHGRRAKPVAPFVGALVWLALYQSGAVPQGHARLGFGAVILAVYTFAIAFEMWRERRKSLYSRAAAILVPCLHAGIFLVPPALRFFLPDVLAVEWLTLLAIETIIYGIGAAFIVLVTVKDRHIQHYRTAATTDHLTGLANRRAFLEGAQAMQARQGRRGEAVTLLMFDLDHFKSVNDRFGHATGDSVLRVFAQVAQANVRASDMVGRLGGEEFVAIVPEAMAGGVLIAERLRAAFEIAGLTVDGHAIGSTVSIGLASSRNAMPDIDRLILRADAALYQAKHGGRNRYCRAEDEPAPVQAEPARQPAARRRPAAPVSVAA